MKALTLTQPWATLVARGFKMIETRSWSTIYRGRIAIHAAKGFPRSAQALLYEGTVISDVLNTPPWELPRGAVIATVELYAIERVCFDNRAHLPPQEPEKSFGDYSEGRYAWFLRDVMPMYPKVPAKGMLGLWEWNDHH